MTNKKNILVTGAGSNCVVNTIKSLRLTGKYKIIATDIYPHSVGAFCADIGYLVSKEDKNNNQFIDDLLNICKKENIALLIPGFDSEIQYIFRAKKQFEEIGVKVIIGNETLLKISYDKHQLYGFFKKNNLPYLKSFEISEKDKALKELSFPLVLKPRSGWGQRGFKIISNHDELIYFIDILGHKSDEYMIQEYIDEKEGEYTNSVTVAEDGDILGCICIKRELVRGTSVRMEIDEFPTIKKQMINIARKIESPGPINIQCRIRDGVAMVFEINSRLSTTNFVRACCDYNEVDLLVDNYLNGNKKIIKQYQKKVALAYMEYVFLEQDQINNFAAEKMTVEQAKISTLQTKKL